MVEILTLLNGSEQIAKRCVRNVLDHNGDLALAVHGSDYLGVDEAHTGSMVGVTRLKKVHGRKRISVCLPTKGPAPVLATRPRRS